jgi:phage shock protein PspC (stress-responsive transcriptional regulator)
MSDHHDDNEQPHEPDGVEAEPASTPTPGTLHRSRTTKVFGGVAGGIGERFDVDANIVRVVFAVLTLVYGLGLAIYLAMWALVPRTPLDGDEAVNDHDRPPRRSVRWLRWPLLSGIIALFFIVVTNLQAHHHRIGPGLGGGVAVIWLIFLVILAIIALRRSSNGFTPGRFLAFSFLGIISFFILTIGAFLIALQVLGVPVEGGSGAKSWSPTSVAQVQRTYHGAYGASTIDLSGVPFTSGTWSITATQGVGVLTVDVPRDATVSLRTHVGIGTVSVAPYGWTSRSSQGPTKDGPHLNLNLQVGVGRIDVVRTSSTATSAPLTPKAKSTNASS